MTFVPEDLVFSDSVQIAATPEAVWDMVADVTRMGEWSPICAACWWDEGAGPTVGGWFTGRNVVGETVWETRSQVVAAERGAAFAWTVGEGWVNWTYTFAPSAGGTLLTESWEFPPAGLALFEQLYGEKAPTHVANRIAAARTGIPVTLAAIRAAAQLSLPQTLNP